MADTLLQDLPPHRGLMIILSSPSGAGKSTMAERLRAWDGSIRFSVSATTRRPRDGEVQGRDYHFHDQESFRDLVARGEMLEHAEVFGNLYGSPRAPVIAALEAGHDVLFDIDWQGGQQIRTTARGEDVVSIFLLPPSIAELERRLIARGKDNRQVIASRMSRARDEISHWAEYDYVLVNNDQDATEAQLRAIVVAERLKRLRRPDLNAHVMALNAEFEERSDALHS